MNYEELLAAKGDGRLNKTQLPIGTYYRMQVDGKWRGFVDIRPELNESVVFVESLKTECERHRTLVNHHQLHYTEVEEQGEVRRLEVEQGVYMSIAQLIEENPAVVVQKGFVDNVLEGLVDVTEYLHSQGIKHVCYSPDTVFVRKGDNSVMLLSHGSFYFAMNNQQELYGDDAYYVAPEVLQHGTIDERCDVYSIGRFMESLFEHASMPAEYKHAMKRATSETPEDRYARPSELLKAVQKRRGTFKTLLMLAAAFIVALLCVGLYFDMVPETEQVEFVKPAPRQAIDDIYDDGFDPAEMGIINADSLSEEDQVSMREYEAKAEAIFRKKYEAEANRILDKIYNKESMSNSEKVFLSQSKSVIEELVQRQQELGEEAGLSQQRSEQIANEINDRLTTQKNQALGGTNTRGIQR
ncbi:MAG: serine/threonine protein kinase [Prevotella sp.]|nr:serine/threonine protein kinase [Prevotella sp.]